MLWASASTSGDGAGSPAPCGFAGPRGGAAGAAAGGPASIAGLGRAAGADAIASAGAARADVRGPVGAGAVWISLRLRRSTRRGAGALSFAARGGAAASGASGAPLAAAGLPRRPGVFAGGALTSSNGRGPSPAGDPLARLADKLAGAAFIGWDVGGASCLLGLV